MSPQNAIPDLDFRHIRSIRGSQQAAFEEFCCQLARRDPEVPDGSRFVRLRGEGGDGGVESYWVLPNGDEWGYQAKFLFSLSKSQIEKSLLTAIEIHPNLRRYAVCLPFDFTGPTGRGRAGTRQVRSDVEKWEEYAAEWQTLAQKRGLTVDIHPWTHSELRDRLLDMKSASGRLRFWFGEESVWADDWLGRQVRLSVQCAGPRYSPVLNVDVPLAAR